MQAGSERPRPRRAEGRGHSPQAQPPARRACRVGLESNTTDRRDPTFSTAVDGRSRRLNRFERTAVFRPRSFPHVATYPAHWDTQVGSSFHVRRYGDTRGDALEALEAQGARAAEAFDAVSKMSRYERRKSRAYAGRQQLLACAKAVAELAEYREIKAMHVSGVDHDLEIRPLLTTVIRRWSLIEPVTDITDEAAALPQGQRHREHVVPVRVLVDRMIMNPSECESLLSEAIVIAHVSRGEHKALRWNLRAPSEDLPNDARR